MVFTALDITERKQAEEELRTAARKWDTTFNGISDAIALLDINCQILQGNQAMADLVGKPLPEILGRNCWELVHGTLGPIEGCPLGRMKASGRRETLTIPMGDRWLHVMVDPIFNKSGQVVGGVHIIADITEQKIAQNRIQDLNTLLKAITEINEALLRVKSEPELFQRTCELLTRVPYVRFVWIGLKEGDSFVV
ncbi:MAG: PAS domain S-box protein, partial [Deltaproteobacteria bacterium]|nr:PAS domain S-box protein [Deltaproteobacteria bacterium]